MTPDQFADMTREELAALSPEVREILHRKMLDLLRDLGVTPLVTPDGQLAVDLAQLAPALGMTVEEARDQLDEAGVASTDRSDMVPLQ